MIYVHISTTFAQTVTQLVANKADSRRLTTDDLKPGKITKPGSAKQSKKKLRIKIPGNATGQASGIGVASSLDSVRSYTVPCVPKLTPSGFSDIATINVRTIVSYAIHALL